MARRVFLHAGTHKTGTTSIQALLGDNQILLEQAGIFVPHTGRLAPNFANHANLAWELLLPHRYDAGAGSLEEVFTELAASPLATACVSSEEFEFLMHYPAHLQYVVDGLRKAGYEPHLVLYLRSQADYLESLYAELISGGWTIRYEEYLRGILADGIYGQSLFDYDRLTRGFESAFGRECMHIRSYRADEPDDGLLRDFLTVVGANEETITNVRRPARLNSRCTLRNVVANRSRTLGVSYRQGPGFPDTPFTPLTLFNLAEIALAFWRSNDAVFRRHGVRVPPISARTLRREIVTALTGGPNDRKNKVMIRSLLDALEIAA